MFSLIKIFLYTFYFFIVVGLFFHTSAHPQIFNKYTYKYLFSLLVLLCLFFPLVKLVDFLEKKSVLKLKSGKKIIFKPLQKTGIVCIIFLLVIFLPAEIFLRLSPINLKASPNILTIVNFHPFLQNKLTVDNNKDDKEIHIDYYGFRAEEIQKEKPKNVYRIFVVGGSTVLNRSVPYEKNFVRLVEKNLNRDASGKKIEVINAGNDGYTSEHSLIDLQFRIKDFQPDAIIVLQGINDMTASCSPIGYSLGKYQPDYSHMLGTVSNIVFSYFQDKPLISINSVFLESVGRFMVHNLYSDVFSFYSSHHKEQLTTKAITTHDFPSIDAYKRNLLYMIQFAQANNIKLILINQPYQYTTKTDTIWYVQRTCATSTTHPDVESLIYGINLFNSATKNIAEQNGILFIDLASQMPKTSEYFADDVHFTEKGNELISQILSKFIKENLIITQ